jgi:hypothetical protein
MGTRDCHRYSEALRAVPLGASPPAAAFTLEGAKVRAHTPSVGVLA